MRAAIAKRFSGDAAPELFRFFRISVGFGCETSTRLALTGVTKVTFRGKKVTGFLRPLWNKTVLRTGIKSRA